MFPISVISLDNCYQWPNQVLLNKCGFYRYALLPDLLWLAVERAFIKNSRKAGTRLFGTLLWKIVKALWLVKYSRKFAEISRKVSILIYFNRLTENQIFLKNLFFKNTDIRKFFYFLVECLQVNRIYVTSFWFHRKLLPEKSNKLSYK